MNGALTVKNNHQLAVSVQSDLPWCSRVWRGWAIFGEDCNCSVISGCDSKSRLCLLFRLSGRGFGCFWSHPTILANSSYVSGGLIPSFTQILVLICLFFLSLYFPLFLLSFLLLPLIVFSDSTVKYSAQGMSLGNNKNTVPVDQNLLDHHGHSFMISLPCYCILNFLF